MQICIFEDDYTGNFHPLALSRPVFDLVCGGSTLREKIVREYQINQYTLFCRNYLSETINRTGNISVNSLPEEDILFINGRIIADNRLPEIIPFKKNRETAYFAGNALAAVSLSSDKVSALNIQDFYNSLLKLASDFPSEKVEVTLAEYIWDLIALNAGQLSNDFAALTGGRGTVKGELYDGVHLVNPDMIFIGEGSKIKPGVVIDAEKGPVYIGENVNVFPNSVIIGPAYIGSNTQIKTGATIYENTSIGNVCKIGGEVEDIIVMPYSNKQHAGFIGHAYLGSWVNLGADTNCSDLKNNYSTVRAYINGNEQDTGLQFLGLIMGDHSKSGINTMFNTGTIAGFCSNIFGAGFPDKFIPSFAWGGSDGFTTYKIDKALQAASKAMERRKVELTQSVEKLFNHIYNLTDVERRKKGIV